MVLLHSLPLEILRRITELLSNDEAHEGIPYKTTLGNLRLVNKLFAQVAQPYVFRRFYFSSCTPGSSLLMHHGSNMHHTRFFLRILKTSSPRIAAYTESARFHFHTSRASLKTPTPTWAELMLDLKIWQDGIHTLGLPPSRGWLEPALFSDNTLPWSASYKQRVKDILDAEYSAVCTTLLLPHMVNLQTLEIDADSYCWKMPKRFSFKLLKLHTLVWNEDNRDLKVMLAHITPLFLAAPNLVHFTIRGGYTSDDDLSPDYALADNHPFGSGTAFSSFETLRFHASTIDVAHLAWLLSRTKQLRTFCYTMMETDGQAGYDPEEMGKALLQVRETLEDLDINRGSLYWVHETWDEWESPDNRLLGSFKNFPKLRRLAVDFLSLVVVEPDGSCVDKVLLDVLPRRLEYLELHLYYCWWQGQLPLALFRQLTEVVESGLLPHLKEVQIWFNLGQTYETTVAPMRVWASTLNGICQSRGIHFRVYFEEKSIEPGAPYGDEDLFVEQFAQFGT